GLGALYLAGGMGADATQYARAHEIAEAAAYGYDGAYAAPVAAVRPVVRSRDLNCLTEAVYYEARSESVRGQRAVAQVVLNRVKHPAFPKSVCAVVFQGAGHRGGCQFS